MFSWFEAFGFGTDSCLEEETLVLLPGEDLWVEKGLVQLSAQRVGGQHKATAMGLLLLTSGQCTSSSGFVVRAAAGPNTEQEQLWDLNHFCFVRSGWEDPSGSASAQSVVSLLALSGAGWYLRVCGVAVFGGARGCISFLLPPEARVVEAIKKALFSFPFCTALTSFAVVLIDNTPWAPVGKQESGAELLDWWERRYSAYLQSSYCIQWFFFFSCRYSMIFCMCL